ncbi:metal-dependent hydrolase [Sinomonas sp. JGH33]|uniref:Metal-dependent hydrolase n=1 Tax=Sinomonas terricola TaxID=3110330 RepID=A0ABU5T3J3_9MICC|nr:metal-dependent hydrolase [Sinomonas sp. JGH33]MEA5454231.1 metal-dependent hydrolase [Sinomonas sp. JGH33]
MMGPHHAACGAAAWVAVTTRIHVDLAPVTQAIGAGPVSFDVGWPLLHATPLGIVAGALVTAGAALLPDADHPSATIAHSLPPVSRALCTGIAAVSGGHRNGTHSFLGIAAFTALAWAAGLWIVDVPGLGAVHAGAGIVSLLLVSFAAKVLGVLPDGVRRIPWLLALPLAAFIAIFAPHEQNWFPLAVALGSAVHIAGDMLTTGGCNLLWPIAFKRPRALSKVPILAEMWRPSGHVSVPILGDAGSWREWLVLVPVSCYAIAGVGTAVFALMQRMSAG